MDYKIGVLVWSITAAGVGLAMAARAIRSAPLVDENERPVLFGPVAHPFHLQHYWVPNGEIPGRDGRWWVFLGADRTVWGFTVREEAVAHAAVMNKAEQRGPFSPDRVQPAGKYVTVVMPGGKEVTVRRSAIANPEALPAAPLSLKDDPAAWWEVVGLGDGKYYAALTRYGHPAEIASRSYTRRRNAARVVMDMNEAEGRVPPMAPILRTRSA